MSQRRRPLCPPKCRPRVIRVVEIDLRVPTSASGLVGTAPPHWPSHLGVAGTAVIGLQERNVTASLPGPCAFR